MLGVGASRPRTGRRVGTRAVVFLALVLILIGLFYYRATLTSLNQELRETTRSGPVSLRMLPYPYHAALGLTLSPGPKLTQEEYVEALRYLVAEPKAASGPGLGLEAGGSIFFYPPSEEWMAYFNPPGPEGEKTRMVYNSLIRAGIIDVLDSYGQDVRFTREKAQHALKALSDQGLTLSTWADRFKSPDNIDSLGGRGGHAKRMAYHLDLTVAAGIRYFWLGRATSIMGQNTVFNWDTFLSLYDSGKVFKSSLGMFLTFARHLAMVLAWSADDPVRNNRLLSPKKFGDGSLGYEYVRYRPLGSETSLEATLTPKFLDRLIATGGRAVVDIQLCPDRNGAVFSENDLAVLAQVADKKNRGLLLVTTTSRLLDLTALEMSLVWKVETGPERIKIIIEGMEDPLTGRREPRLEELAGLTFYVPDSSKADLYIGERKLKVRRNLIDRTGRESVSLPWPRLSLPEIPRRNN